VVGWLDSKRRSAYGRGVANDIRGWYDLRSVARKAVVACRMREKVVFITSWHFACSVQIKLGDALEDHCGVVGRPAMGTVVYSRGLGESSRVERSVHSPDIMLASSEIELRVLATLGLLASMSSS